ncbi:N-formylglutamate amidohydrolase superfamily [Synechococcus sp. PCC 7335]|uniref:N-formylglutamate amidohydrolase n=1 Tax=Synechococcus sp. (strain ATCC 29403 / PCC 7335) TaxID=91464 RepID=UPI00017EE46E|nr:N-formylglutamate amidohydrolase [Synechococcus sp. PCC 7335]EDX87090.1 N-formylglutamate amidohydrolase superfamily [Synechococcus sp. PCC 7335]
MTTDLFTVLSPESSSVPILANLPHSGLQVPDSIARTFTTEQLQTLPNSDWHLQPLYDFLPSLGITLMQANYSRYVVDLNRALKPPLFGSFWSAVVPEQTAFKQDIYTTKPTEKEVQARIKQYYDPYHQQLSKLLNEAIAQHGKVYLLDLHSFMGLISDEVCLGNARGKTCSESTLDIISESFSNQAFQVVKNKVFTGGYITRHYGQYPSVEALQIEIRYPVYLPDDQLEVQAIPHWRSPKFKKAKCKLEAVFIEIVNQLIKK